MLKVAFWFSRVFFAGSCFTLLAYLARGETAPVWIFIVFTVTLAIRAYLRRHIEDQEKQQKAKEKAYAYKPPHLFESANPDNRLNS